MTCMLSLLALVGTATAAAPARVTLKLETGTTAAEIAHLARADLVSQVEELDLATLAVPPGTDPAALARRLAQLDRVRWAEVDGQVRAFGAPDPMRRAQWNLRRLDARGAWACGATGDGIVVAVLDTGLALDGRDTPAHLPGIDLVDEDDDTTDRNGHGTHVAGTIAQATGNGVGVAGLARDAEILPVRVLDDEGVGWTSDLASGIAWATLEGADIINMSLGFAASSLAVEEAISFAREAEVVLVAAAGNDGTDGVAFPAANEGVVAVAATTASGERASYSNMGPELDFAAPGGEPTARYGILQETVDPDGEGTRFLEKAGTSMAAPHVAAAYAILMSVGAPPERATELLAETAADLGDEGWDPATGYGEIRVAEAVVRLATETVPAWSCDW